MIQTYLCDRCNCAQCRHLCETHADCTKWDCITPTESCRPKPVSTKFRFFKRLCPSREGVRSQARTPASSSFSSSSRKSAFLHVSASSATTSALRPTGSARGGQDEGKGRSEAKRLTEHIVASTRFTNLFLTRWKKMGTHQPLFVDSRR